MKLLNCNNLFCIYKMNEEDEEEEEKKIGFA